MSVIGGNRSEIGAMLWDDFAEEYLSVRQLKSLGY